MRTVLRATGDRIAGALFSPPANPMPPPVTLAEVDSQLAKADRLSLGFAPEIEAHYEFRTRAARAWNIRLTVPLGLIAYLAFGMVDATLLPDLGWIPMLLRVLLITPVGLFAMWMCSRTGATFREGFISVSIAVTLLVPVTFIAVSRSPMAPYSMLVVILVSMFGNILMRLRFHWACAFSVLTVAAVSALVWLRPDLPAGLCATMMIATLVCVTFGIVANHQLERAERRSFLLTLRETLRSAQLNADKDSIAALSLSDALTGLPNRRAFDSTFERLWDEWKSAGQAFALVMVDVDHFKRYNDHYGHPAGDACLQQVGALLRKSVTRQRDLVARYGGEEFVVLLSGCELPEALVIAQRLCESVARAGIAHHHREDGLSAVTVSAGVAGTHFAAIRASREDLLGAADESLYEAKRSGRNRAMAWHALPQQAMAR